MKTCPECAEEVRRAARICRFCGHRFPDAESSENRRRVAPRRRRRASGAIAALVITALVAGVSIGSGQSADEDGAGARAAVPRESATPPRCSEGSVATELERRRLLDRRDFSGVEQVSCQDLTGDRIDDAFFVRGSTGSASTKGWGVLVGQKDGAWDLSLFRQAETGIQIDTEGKRVIRRQPIYQPEDPHCCPTGGTEVEVYVYRAGRFEIVEQYSEQPPAPESGSPDEPEASGPAGEEGSSDRTPCTYRGEYAEGLCTPEENELVERETDAHCEEQRRASEMVGEEYVPDWPC